METFFPTSSTPDLTTRPQASYGELVDFWNNNQTKDAELEEKNKSFTKSIENLQYTNRLHESQVEQFMTTLFAYLRDGEIDESVAEDFAECFGRDLTRTVNVSITIHGEMEVNLPHGMTIDDLAEELDFGPNVHYATGIEVNYVDLSTVEIEEV